MKGLYNTRNADNTTNAVVLGFFLIIFNIHSIVVLLECFTRFNIGVLAFWTPNKIPKVGLGYLVGLLFAVAFLIVAHLVKKNTPAKERRAIMKRIVSGGSTKTSSVLYTVISVLLFLVTTLLLIVKVIPDGGI